MKINRAQIMGSRRRRTDIDVPEWGGEVTVLALSVGQLLAITGAAEVKQQIETFTRVISEVVIDDEGTAILSYEDVSTFEAAVILEVGKKLVAATNASFGKDEEVAKNS